MRVRLLSVGCLALLLVGCVPYRQPTWAFANRRRADADEVDREIRAAAARSPLYAIVPRDRRQIWWFDAPHWISWALLGNERDGIFGEDTDPPFTRTPDAGSFLAWQVRNPLNNFCFYVIGSADWQRHVSLSVFRSDARGFRILKGEEDPSVFGEGKSSFTFAFNDFKPFLSFKFPWSSKRQMDFYLGWRPEGHFGIKIRPWTSVKQTS
jgi:hypothetical protein